MQQLTSLIIPLLILLIISYGLLKHIAVYEEFVDGAKEGFSIAVNIIPYLVAMLFAIAILRASGALDFILILLSVFCRISQPASGSGNFVPGIRSGPPASLAS